MAKKKTSALKTVKKAAKAIAATADEYVVKPVGKVLGLKKKPVREKKPRSKTQSTTKTAATRRKSAGSKSKTK